MHTYLQIQWQQTTTMGEDTKQQLTQVWLTWDLITESAV
jgi:hypothetical protein